MTAPATVRTLPRAQGGAESAPVEPLRILQVVEPGMDGAFQVVNMLTRKLIESGHVVSLAYSDRRSSASLPGLLDVVRSAGGECLNLRTGNAPEPADLTALISLWKLARRFRPGIIHAHSSKAGALARALPAAGIRARFFYSPHAYYGLSGRPGLRTHVFNLVERALGGVGQSFMTSQGEADFALRSLSIPSHRLHLISNPVDTVRFRPAEDRASVRRQLGVPEGSRVLGWVGRLSFQKDPQTCYRALAPLLRENPDLFFLQIGKGELDGELRALAASLGIEDRLIRHEHLTEPRLAYQAMDGLIMTSRYEGLSLVMLEALASNLPLILSEMQGVSDLEPQRLSHCWTAPVGDETAFTAVIGQWLRDLPAQRPCNHRDEAIARFSIDRWLATHLAAYRG